MIDIEQMVMDKYPKTDAEKRGCSIEIMFRENMRQEYREKLLNELNKENKKNIIPVA